MKIDQMKNPKYRKRFAPIIETVNGKQMLIGYRRRGHSRKAGQQILLPEPINLTDDVHIKERKDGAPALALTGKASNLFRTEVKRKRSLWVRMAEGARALFDSLAGMLRAIERSNEDIKKAADDAYAFEAMALECATMLAKEGYALEEFGGRPALYAAYSTLSNGEKTVVTLEASVLHCGPSTGKTECAMPPLAQLMISRTGGMIIPVLHT